jgi:hypothetical protein
VGGRGIEREGEREGGRRGYRERGRLSVKGRGI